MNLTFVETCDICKGLSPFDIMLGLEPKCPACSGKGVFVWTRKTKDSPWKVFDNFQFEISQACRMVGVA